MSKRLAVIIYGVNNPVQTPLAIRYAKENSDPETTEIVLVDNGSDPPYADWGQDRTVRYAENMGGNAVFHRWMPDEDDWFDGDPPEFLAFCSHDSASARSQAHASAAGSASNRSPVRRGLAAVTANFFIDTWRDQTSSPALRNPSSQ